MFISIKFLRETNQLKNGQPLLIFKDDHFEKSVERGLSS